MRLTHFNRIVMTVVGLGLAACSGDPATSPGPAPPLPVLTHILPLSGPTTGGTAATISGSGFLAGATVRFADTAAQVTSISSNAIVIVTPPHPFGFADVVVINPDGHRGMLSRGFSFVLEDPSLPGDGALYKLTASPEIVAPGRELTLTWNGPRPTHTDWVGLFKVGDPNTAQVWANWANNSNKFTIPAPASSGEYEFRYLPNEGIVDIARSNPVKVVVPSANR